MVQYQKPLAEEVIESTNSFYGELLGYRPEFASLHPVPSSQWGETARKTGVDPESEGAYFPRNQVALVKGGNRIYLPGNQNSFVVGENSNGEFLSLFHEYFGHGLYCEQSSIGRNLVNLENKLLEEEKQEFQGKSFTLEDLKNFRQNNSTYQILEEFRKRSYGYYELFAVFTEYLLSHEFGLEEQFEKRYDSMNSKDREAIDFTINFSKEFGTLAAFYYQGLARKPTPERVKGLLEDVYGSDKKDNFKLGVLYGSKKPFSDIDVFTVTDSLKETVSGWLDVRTCSAEDFEWRLNRFDLAVTDPILTGEFVIGNHDYFDSVISRLNEQEITNEAIDFNLKEAERHKVGMEGDISEEMKNKYFNYYRSYKLNGEALQKGLKLLTKRSLFDFFGISQREISNKKECEV